jgi:predicted anti-sigma-YlaC factor YlaD
MPDHDGMRCEECREALSARLDGEDAPDERAPTDTHLAGCVDCRIWWDTAASLTRLARTGAVSPAPTLPDTVLDAAPGPWRARVTGGLRILLGAIGGLQLALGMVQISGTTASTAYLHAGHLPDAGHLWHESTAWNIAVGTGFLWVAARRVRPTGVLPILTAFVGMLTLLSASDILAGRVEGARLASHAFVITGYAVIVALTRPSFDFAPPPGGPRLRTWQWRVHFDTDESTTTQPTPLPRPLDGTAGHRRAA